MRIDSKETYVIFKILWWEISIHIFQAGLFRCILFVIPEALPYVW